MFYDMHSLREALAPIKQLGEGRIEFDCAGNSVVLRLLTPQEELEVFQYARSVIEDIPEDERDIALTTLYFDRFRVGTLSKAVISIGDWELPSENDTVMTGETLENGKPVSIPFRVAFRDEMSTWGRPLLERMFAKYGELMEQVSARARKAIEVEQVDYDTEIEQTEARLEELRQAKVEAEKEGKDIRDEHVSVAKSVSGGMSNEVAAIAQTGGSDSGEPVTTSKIQAPRPIGPSQPQRSQKVAPVLQERQTLIPTEAPPPSPRQVPTQQEPEPEVQEPAVVPDTMPSSMVNPNDEDAFRAAMLAEERRQMAIRARAQAMAQQMPIPQAGQAPHHQAALLSREFEDTEIQSVGTIPLGNGREAPAYKMPTQEVTGKAAPKARNPVEAGVNERPDGAKNPKFRPPKR